jgi:hypothetical protein
VARILVALLVFLFALPAEARAVKWTAVEVRAGDDSDRVAKAMRKLLERQSRKADWGKGKPLQLSAHVTQLDWEERGDVVRVTVTVVAKISGGHHARSKIRLGGKPSARRKLEQEALGIVAGGLVTRLSNLAREPAPKAPTSAGG